MAITSALSIADFKAADFDDPDLAEMLAVTEPMIDECTREIAGHVARGETVGVFSGGRLLYVVVPTADGVRTIPAERWPCLG